MQGREKYSMCLGVKNGLKVDERFLSKNKLMMLSRTLSG